MPSSKISEFDLDPSLFDGMGSNEDLEEIKSSLNIIDTNINSIKTTTNNINTNTNNINTTINTINTNASTAATKATAAATDAASVKTTVSTINTNINTANTNINSIKSTVDSIKTSVASSGSVKSIQSGFLRTRSGLSLPTTENMSIGTSKSSRVPYEQITIGSVDKNKCIVNIYTTNTEGVKPMFGVVTGSTSLAVYIDYDSESTSTTISKLFGYRWEVIEYY